MQKVIQNAVRVHNTYYLSRHRHDWVPFKDELGLEGFIDGGIDYVRLGGEWLRNPFKHGVVDYCLYSDSSTTDILNKLLWGNFGINSNQPLVWKPIRDLELAHLEAILRTQSLNPFTVEVIEYWINHHKSMLNNPPILKHIPQEFVSELY